MKRELISIVVPVYNVEKYLRRCVDSLRKQTYEPIEIILVNDGSKDSSLSICRELEKEDKRIVVIDKPNGGLSSARNAGIRASKGKYLGFVDSDDYVESSMYEMLYNANKKNGTKISVGGRFDLYEENDKVVVGLCPNKDDVISGLQGIKNLLTWKEMDSSACDKLFSRDILADDCFPEGRMSEDVAVMYRLFDSVDKISTVAKPFYYYFHRANSISTSSFSEKSFDIVKNVKSIGEFINSNNLDINEEFKFFKCNEYTSLLSLMARSKKRYKETELELIKEVKSCSSVFSWFNKKERIRVRICSNRLTYSIFRFVKRLSK